MKKLLRSLLTLALILALLFALEALFPNFLQSLSPASSPDARPAATAGPDASPPSDGGGAMPDEDGEYDRKDELALYIHLYGHLPGNFVTKREAEAAGWNGGSLESVLPGKCIGGDRFGNREGLLPKAKGRTWTECDVGTLGRVSRGAKRIVFSNDGLIYYSPDHYESFELLYGEP